METNVIYNEDCLITLSKMPDNSVDMVVTSPPYNKGFYNKDDKWEAWGNAGGGIKYDTYEDAMLPQDYEAWQKKLLSELLRVLKPTGSIFYNHKDIIYKGLIVHPKWVYDFPVREIIIWDRASSPQIGDRFFMPITEYLWWIVKDAKQVFFDKSKSFFKTNIFKVSIEKNPHPAPFPMKLINSLIASCTPPISHL